MACRIERRDDIESAYRVVQNCGYAIASGIAKRIPVADLRGAQRLPTVRWRTTAGIGSSPRLLSWPLATMPPISVIASILVLEAPAPHVASPEDRIRRTNKE